MVPILLGGAALWGIITTSDNNDKLRNANNINSQAAEIANKAKAEIDKINSNMNESLETLGRTTTTLMNGNINDFVRMMSSIYEFEYRNNPSGLQKLEQMGFQQRMVEEMEQISNKAIALSSTQGFNAADDSSYAAVGLLGAGLLLGAGAMIAAPAMIIYNMMKSDEAEAALYEAQTRLDEARLYQEQCKNIATLFGAIGARSRSINNLLNDLDRYYEPILDDMSRIVRGSHGYDFDSYNDREETTVFLAYQMTQTMKILVEAPIVEEDWSINPLIDSRIEQGQQQIQLLKEAN